MGSLRTCRDDREQVDWDVAAMGYLRPHQDNPIALAVSNRALSRAAAE
jgi:hypothetical protein